MESKSELIAELNRVFKQWEEFLRSFNYKQLTTRLPASTWSIKKVIAHLYAWQQVSIARLDAAIEDRLPAYPAWVEGSDPDVEELLEEHNESIFQLYRAESWSAIHHMWEAGFQHLLQLAESFPEQTLQDAARFPWLGGYPLMAVLSGTLNHHREHLDSVRIAFNKN
jgi:hypothetical protein